MEERRKGTEGRQRKSHRQQEAISIAATAMEWKQKQERKMNG
jgi:hypothetical protein